MRILSVITAREQSKRLPNKNFRRILGLSLTERAVIQGVCTKMNGSVSEVVLSTDSRILLEQNKKYCITDIGTRPDYLSTDTSKSVDVLLYTLNCFKKIGKRYDAVMILQPTSPLRTQDDIEEAIRVFITSGKDSLITACRIPNATINGLYYKKENSYYPINSEHNSGKRHQDLDPIYLRNGAVFISTVSYLEKEGKIISNDPAVYEMPYCRSIDIDDVDDLDKARNYLQSLNPAQNEVLLFGNKLSDENRRMIKKLIGESSQLSE